MVVGAEGQWLWCWVVGLATGCLADGRSWLGSSSNEGDGKKGREEKENLAFSLARYFFVIILPTCISTRLLFAKPNLLQMMIINLV